MVEDPNAPEPSSAKLGPDASAPISVFRVDPQGVFLAVGGYPFEQGHLREADFIGHSYREIFAGRTDYLSNIERALSGELFQDRSEYEGSTYDTTFVPQFDEAGRPAGFVGIALDLTEQLATIAELRQSEELKRRIIENVPGGVVLVSEQGAVLDANPTAQGILGVSFDALTKRFISDFEPETIWEDGTPCSVEDYPVARCLMTREPQPPATIGVRTPGGEISWAVFTAVPIFDPLTRDFKGAVVTFLDITERKREEETRKTLERQLAQSQKLEAIGRLASGLAHDLNNILSAVLGHASLLKAKFDESTSEHGHAATIEQAGERAALLTQQLLGFAGLGKHEDAVVDVDAAVKEILALLASGLHPNIEIEHTQAEHPALVRGDPGQIHQVLLNLALNARDAMPRGGRLRFETKLESRHTNRPGADYVRVAVSDEGEGIAPELLDRIFDPFFTTKGPDQGSGMGLAMVEGIVTNHGGFVEVDSRPGAGSTFRLYFPPPDAALAKPKDSRPPRETSALLPGVAIVIDDEPLVRGMAELLLTRLGMEARSFGDGASALEHLRSHPADVSLVLLDMVMPGMDGTEVFDRLQALKLAAPIVITSGFAQDGAAQKLLERGAAGFLPKPYGLERIETLLRRLLRP